MKYKLHLIWFNTPVIYSCVKCRLVYSKHFSTHFLFSGKIVFSVREENDQSVPQFFFELAIMGYFLELKKLRNLKNLLLNQILVHKLRLAKLWNMTFLMFLLRNKREFSTDFRYGWLHLKFIEKAVFSVHIFR